MFFLNNKINFLLFIIFINTIGFSYAESNDSFIYYDNIDNVTKTLNQFKDDNFNKYLKEASHYEYNNYYAAISSLFYNYRNHFKKMNCCVEIGFELEKKYNDDWINGLLSLAGPDYVIKNIKSIQNLLHNINNKHYKSFCIDSEKELNFSEIQYLSVVNDFFNLYLSYLDTLSESKRKELKKNKDLAENIINSLGRPPFQVMRYGGRLGTYLNLTYNVDLKPEIIEYILNHPTFLSPFNFVQAIQDVRKLSPTN